MVSRQFGRMTIWRPFAWAAFISRSWEVRRRMAAQQGSDGEMWSDRELLATGAEVV